MATTEPQISVFIPCYNFEAYIRQCLDSVLAQTLMPDQIIVSDDCSTDRSWEIICQYQARFPDLIVAHRYPENVGHQQNGNDAQKRCTGDFVTSIDGDDYWLPGKLESEWKAIQKMPGAALAYCGVIEVDDLGNQLARWVNPADPEPPSGDVFVEVFSKQFFRNMPNIFRNPLIRRDALEAVGHQDQSLSLYVDWDQKIRLTSRYKVAYAGQALVVYRRHPRGISRHMPDVHFRDLKAIWKKNSPLLVNRPREEQERVRRGFQSELARFRPQESNESIELKLPPSPEPIAVSQHWKGEGLVLLVSLPRSGSTLLQRLLGGHSQIHTVSEPWILMHPFYALKDTGIQTEFDINLARQGLKDFTAELPGGHEDYLNALRNMVGYLYDQVRQHSGKPIFLDKTPRYYRILPEIHQVLPEARVILLYRNPLAVLSSVLRSWMDNSVQLLKQTSNYKDMVEGPTAMLEGEKLLADQAIRVSYEQLLLSPEDTLRSILRFIGVDYEDQILNIDNSPVLNGRLGDKHNSKRYSTIVRQHAEEWKEHLTGPASRPYALQFLETLGRSTVTAMGYSCDDIRQTLSGEQPGDRHASESTEPQPASDAQSLNRKGEQLFEQGRTDEAMEIFRVALEQAPDDPDVLNNTGVLLMVQGNNTEALQLFIRGLSITENHSDLVMNTASLLEQINKASEALELCQAYLAKYPSDKGVRQVLENLQKHLENETFHPAESIPEHDHNRTATPKSAPRVSVLVSTWGSEEFMDECLHDLVNQSIAERLEIIVIDAASPQNEKAIAERYQKQFDNIRYIRTPQRIGVYAAWNLAIRESQGEYLFTFSTNDRLRADACEILARALEDNPDAALVYGDSYLTRTPHQTFGQHTRSGAYHWPEYRFEEHLQRCLIGPHPMWRRGVHEQIGLFDESFVAIGDQDMWLRIACSYALLHVNEVTGLYWETDDALSHKGQRPLQEIAKVQETYRKRYENTLARIRECIAGATPFPSTACIVQACPGFVPSSSEGLAAMERVSCVLADEPPGSNRKFETVLKAG